MISGSQLYIFQDMPGIHSDFVVNKAHSHGNSEVMQSACICSYQFVLLGILLVIVSSTLVHGCENNEVMHSACSNNKFPYIIFLFNNAFYCQCWFIGCSRIL